MLKVLCVVDKEKTALDRLAQGVAKYHTNIEYKVLSVHPKRPDTEQLEAFVREAMDADILDWQYFRTAEMLRSKFDFLSSKKHILTHNNPYSITESDWNSYDLNIGNNNYIYEKLAEITATETEYIPLCVDTDFWLFNNDWQAKRSVIMVANRIEAKKGILPVAIAANELNLNFILVGAVSDMNYFQSILATGPVEFHEQISDEELRDLYYKSTLHICNSVDNFESGTLPILESMLCGTPVLSRPVGHVPELNNGSNMILNENASDDVINLRELIASNIFEKKKLEDMRQAGWQTAKTRSFERRAYSYQKAYRKVISKEKTVSVIVPIYDKPEVIIKCLDSISLQTYDNIEIIVADDNEESNEKIVKDFSRFINIPIRYINTAQGDYGLARARNEAIIEATGDILVFCDQRMQLEPDCIENFVKYLGHKQWLYGNKGGKKEFVENLSCVYRDDVIDAGMFNERMIWYGGLSQETRARIRNQGFTTEYIDSAKANAMGKSSNRNRKRADIIKSKNRLFKMNLQ